MRLLVIRGNCNFLLAEEKLLFDTHVVMFPFVCVVGKASIMLFGYLVALPLPFNRLKVIWKYFLADCMKIYQKIY